jgi:hypothetical protein
VQTFGLAITGGTLAERLGMLDRIRVLGVPSLGFHLDLWHGLDRADQLATEAFFRVDLLATADGGHDDEWQALGVNHVWSPPAVYHGEAVDGIPQARYPHKLIFVGSHQGYGHAEHAPTREAMLAAVRSVYPNDFRCWPDPGRGAIRGMELNDLYASCKIAVGDSCLGGLIPRYCSDRCFETPGRGALLIHPYVEGLDPYLVADKHFIGYPVGDWSAMLERIDYYLRHDDEREAIRRAGAEHVRSSQTYRDRLATLIETLREQGLLEREEVAAWD